MTGALACYDEAAILTAIAAALDQLPHCPYPAKGKVLPIQTRMLGPDFDAVAAAEVFRVKHAALLDYVGRLGYLVLYLVGTNAHGPVVLWGNADDIPKPTLTLDGG